MSRIIMVLLALASPPTTAASPVYTHYTLEALIDIAENITIGRVTSVTEKMEQMSLDGIVSPFLVVTVHLEDVEVLRGDLSKNSIRQYSSLANRWNVGEKVLVFSMKPTDLGFDPILGGGILRVDGENAKGLILYEGVTRTSMPFKQIRKLLKK